MKKVMSFVLEEYYDNNWDIKKKYTWKLSIDGKNSKDLGGGGVKKEKENGRVLIGLTPLQFGDNRVNPQSPYSVFICAFYCGSEKRIEMIKELGENYYKENSDFLASGKIKVGNKIHMFDILIVADLVAGWKVFVFGGNKCITNCPLCRKKKTTYNPNTETWSRDDITNTFFGIGIDKFYIDTLHLLLRITDIVILKLYLKIKNTPILKEFETYMNDNLKVGFATYEKKGKGKEQFIVSYDVAECLLILQNGDALGKFYSDIPHLQESYTFICVTFYNLYKQMDEGELCDDWDNQVLAWGQAMENLFGIEFIRIYVHIFCAHVNDLIDDLKKKNLTLKGINQQGFENAHSLHNRQARNHSTRRLYAGTMFLKKQNREVYSFFFFFC